MSVDRRQIAAILTHRFSDRLTLRQALRYSDWDITAIYLQATGVDADQRTASRRAVSSNYLIEMTQSDTHVTYEVDTGRASHTLLVGVDCVTIPTEQGTGVGAAGAIDLYAPRYGSAVALPDIAQIRYQDFEQTGVYVQDQIGIGRLSLQLGWRHDSASSDTSTLVTATGDLGSPTTQDDEASTGQIGAIYAIGRGFAPYISWSESFRPTPGASFDGDPFKPETGEQYEVGLKYAPDGLNAIFTLAAFEIAQQNVRTPDLDNPGFLVQTGEVESRGWELEAKGSLSSSLNFAAALTRLSHKVTKSNAGDTGNTPPGRPKHEASVWIDYPLPFLSGLTLGAGVRYVGDSYGDRPNSFEVPAYTLYDGLVRYHSNSWDVSLNLHNIGDERYVANCDAATQCFYGTGRTTKLTLRRKW